jgi:hypothetical protein
LPSVEEEALCGSTENGAKSSEQPPTAAIRRGEGIEQQQQQQPQCTLVTVGYHIEDWPWGFEASFAPRDVDMGPGPPVEIRKLKGPPCKPSSLQ